MSNVVLLQWLSLDGVAEEPSDWFFDDGPELFALIARVIEPQRDVLLGRGTYDYWVDYWPTSDVEPFASFINATRKHVASSSELAGHWNNAVRMTAPVDEYVRKLKQQAEGDIGIHGSTELAGSLIAAQLVDEIRFVMPPTIAGHGKRLFDGPDTALQQFDLLDVEQTPKGTLFLHYPRGCIDVSERSHAAARSGRLTGWVVAEHGGHAGYVINIKANPAVRVCVKGKWRNARAAVVPDDNAEARLDGFGRSTHAATLRRFGTDLTTLRFDFTDA